MKTNIVWIGSCALEGRKSRMKIYKCEKCGNIVVKLVDKGVPLSCCGQMMKELVANTTDAAQEKHVPMVSVEGNVLKVDVGEISHPMTPEHYIQMIMVVQDEKVQYVTLKDTDKPKAEFIIESGKKYTVYQYCNLHGLWKK